MRKDKRSDLLQDLTGDGIEYVMAKAFEVVQHGMDKALKNVPMACYGKYQTADREEIERINAIKNLILQYQENKNDYRPLSIAVFGTPGSGKSFAIKQLSEEYKDYYRDPSGQTYVYSVDPYIFLIEARNLLNYGTVWDKSGGSALRRAPRGESLPPSILPHFTVYFYKFLNLFKTTSLETAAFYLPVILGMISIMFVFFISRKIMNNDLFAFFSAF